MKLRRDCQHRSSRSCPGSGLTFGSSRSFMLRAQSWYVRKRVDAIDSFQDLLGPGERRYRNEGDIGLGVVSNRLQEHDQLHDNLVVTRKTMCW
jgi:hypothetical protein